MVSVVPGDQKQRVKRYSIIGEQSAGGVCHVGLLAIENDVSAGDEVTVHHMTTQALRLEPAPSSPGETRMSAHVIGWVGENGLTRAQTDDVETWLERLQTLRREVVKYAVHPPYQVEKDAESRVVSRRYSCAGFVVHCYFEGAQVALVEGVSGEVFDDSRLPRIGVEDIVRIWPMPGLSVPRLLGRVGLTGEPPWPVLLPGYLLDACAGDCFPHQPGGCSCGR